MDNPTPTHPRPRYPVEYLQQQPRTIRRSRPDYIQPDPNSGFADDSEGTPGKADWCYNPPIPYF